MTVLDAITEAGIMGGVFAIGETISAAEGQYGLSKLNNMVDLWAAKRLAIYRRQRAGPFTVASGTASYTIGTGGTWNVARPLWIDGAGIIYTAGSTPNPELPMDVLTTKQWAQIMVKAITSTLPRALFYDRTFTTGFGTIYLYPVPSQASQIVLYVPIAVPEFATLVETLSLPPGYRSAIISNLAVLMCLGLKAVPADVKEEAILSFGTLQSSNVVTHMDALSCDPATRVSDRGGAAFNWIDGDVR